MLGTFCCLFDPNTVSESPGSPVSEIEGYVDVRVFSEVQNRPTVSLISFNTCTRRHEIESPRWSVKRE